MGDLTLTLGRVSELNWIVGYPAGVTELENWCRKMTPRWYQKKKKTITRCRMLTFAEESREKQDWVLVFACVFTTKRWQVNQKVAHVTF